MKDVRTRVESPGATPPGRGRGWPFVVRPDLDWTGPRGALREPSQAGRSVGGRSVPAPSEPVRQEAARQG